jgi:alpha-amylase/alpha-mannosidase (GH57 family)
MTKPLAVAFLWHMHQPYYLDDPTGRVSLPWVRLHALKAYVDMTAMLERWPQAGCTINIVPSLARQLQAYAERPDLEDAFLTLTRRPAADLDDAERKFLLRFFFMSNWETMVRPNPGYARLLDLRGVRPDEATLDRAGRVFSHQDLRDLQVWFNLSWCGFTARRDPRIAALLAKGMGFSEADKRMMLEAQDELLRQVIPRWRELAARQTVELSTSPFYHPILPILAGSAVVRRSMPDVALPGDFSFAEDAKAQIERGVQYFAQTFGRSPEGMWPSEGSVCPEIIPYLADAGVKWIATDEGILFRSLDGGQPRHALFEPYAAVCRDAQVAVFFRDRYLSDLIGFTYAKNPAATAVRDFIGHLGRISEAAPGGVVSVVLDGENPWEYYPDGGEAFLDGLYRELTTGARLKPVSLARALAEHPPTKTLTRLHSGSWINANFAIWIGGPEENRAWSLLDRTRSHLEAERQAGRCAPDQLEAAREQLFQAEGSDWFWWYGDDFNSDSDADFDRLFRQKLANVHRALGETPPASLDEPIHVDKSQLFITMPLAFIRPTLDGRQTHFYEWADAGFLDLSRARGSMHLSKNLLSALMFGFDAERLFLRLDPAEDLRRVGADLEVRIHLAGRVERQVRFPLLLGAPNAPACAIFGPTAEDGWGPAAGDCRAAVDEIAEIAVPFALLEIEPGEPFSFLVHLMKGEVEEDRFPKNGRVHLVAPDANYDSLNWSV